MTKLNTYEEICKEITEVAAMIESVEITERDIQVGKSLVDMRDRHLALGIKPNSWLLTKEVVNAIRIKLEKGEIDSQEGVSVLEEMTTTIRLSYREELALKHLITQLKDEAPISNCTIYEDVYKGGYTNLRKVIAKAYDDLGLNPGDMTQVKTVIIDQAKSLIADDVPQYEVYDELTRLVEYLGALRRVVGHVNDELRRSGEELRSLCDKLVNEVWEPKDPRLPQTGG